ncbi:NAD+ synthase [Terriglobus aquaticus]|uniref:Glutamine-dependent NAD(+) synthetase n=1 Tax=Terriglobus aquaticus TaxID=940139 RepID=A0ABW9KKS0_9BACT|nr:NAD+ synthase [Terriglobus aquaticus]
MKIALAQLNPTVGDFAGNVRDMLRAAEAAAQQGARLVLFPELAVCGYPPKDLIESSDFLHAAQRAADQITAASARPDMPAMLFGCPLPFEKRPGKLAKNVAILCANGEVLLEQQKMLLPFYDVFDEQRYFEPGTEQHLVELDGEVLAITVCEDAWNDKDFWPERWYENDPVDRLMHQRMPDGRAPQIILNISASPYWEGKEAIRREMLAAVARRHNVPVAMCNQVGGNDSLLFDGGSFALRCDGELAAHARTFETDLVFFDSTCDQPALVPNSEPDIAQDWQALVLGTRDYLHKTGFTQGLVGLSGGIDSALVAAIAVEALGEENVFGIGMPSEFSSGHSIDDARELASNLGIRFELLPIRPGVDAMSSVLDPVFHGTPFGLAEENLQSRLRGVLLMAVSNKFGHLVLTTGNKSEMATGYCTLYGDMAGALAVIGDVWKTRVYQLAHYANRNGIVIPENTISKPPSAELRPGQLDTDSLPPYEILDPLLQAYVERYESAEQIATAQHLDLALVERVLRLVQRSEYKRQQAAPILKITRKSFGPGRRFPLAAKFSNSNAPLPSAMSS